MQPTHTFMDLGRALLVPLGFLLQVLPFHSCSPSLSMTQGTGLSGADPDEFHHRQRNWKKREAEWEQAGFVCKKRLEALKVKWARESLGKVLPLVECGPEKVRGTNRSDELLLPFLWVKRGM